VAGVNFEFPMSRILLAGVVTRDAFEVLDQVESQWRVDVNLRRDAWERLFLHERRVKVSRIERHQADVGHSAASHFLLGGCLKNECRCDCRTQHGKKREGDSAKFGFHSSPMFFVDVMVNTSYRLMITSQLFIDCDQTLSITSFPTTFPTLLSASPERRHAL